MVIFKHCGKLSKEYRSKKYLLNRLVALVGQSDGNEDKAEEQYVHYRIGYKSMKDEEDSIKLKFSS